MPKYDDFDLDLQKTNTEVTTSNSMWLRTNFSCNIECVPASDIRECIHFQK